MNLNDGCQGKKKAKIREIPCPECGAAVEMVSTDVFAECENCGAEVMNELMDCVFTCSQAEECVGSEVYRKVLEAKKRLEAKLEDFADDDEW